MSSRRTLCGGGLNKPCIKNIKYHFILEKKKTPDKYFEEQNIFGKTEKQAVMSSRRTLCGGGLNKPCFDVSGGDNRT